ncbi:MAG: hypothetical protein ACK4N5_18250, partial [Myxococcales bacterium]
MLALGADARAQTASVQGRITVREVKDGALVERSEHDGAIVYVLGFEQPPPSKPAVMSQQGRQFVPQVLAVTVGQDVVFENDDGVYHNVFSHEPKFDVGQVESGPSRPQKVAKPGVVRVFCNVHPEMAGWILSVPNRAHAATAKDGGYRIADIPPGKHTVVVYHPRAKAAVQREVEFKPGQTAIVDATIDATVSLATHK